MMERAFFGGLVYSDTNDLVDGFYTDLHYRDDKFDVW